MSDKLPKSLGTDTILEAIFEVRFESDPRLPGNILPGTLYQSLKSSYPKIDALPPSQLPEQIRQLDPNLKYLALQKMSDGQFSVLIGPNVFAVSCQRPYIGWVAFKERILSCLDSLKGTGFADSVIRYSVKYVNMIPKTEQGHFGSLRVEFKAGKYDISTTQTHIRSEFPENGFINIIQMVSPAEAVSADFASSGVILDIDVIHQENPGNLWGNTGDLLDSVHLQEKRVFFGLLKDETIKSLGPVYD